MHQTSHVNSRPNSHFHRSFTFPWKEEMYWSYLTICVSQISLINYFLHPLLQNATDISTKCHKKLLQNVSGFLLYNGQFYYKIPQVLQKTTIFLEVPTVITNCDVYNAPVHCLIKFSAGKIFQLLPILHHHSHDPHCTLFCSWILSFKYLN